MKNGPKVVVIGGGSLFFGRQALWQMVHSPNLNTGTLSFVENNPKRLDLLTALAKKVIAHTGVSLKFEAFADHRRALDGADFVVLSFANDTVKYRGIDIEISARHGIRMCSGDTIGPGGIFRTLREFPVILSIVNDVRKQCPNAWVINYVNPSSAMGIGLMRYAPDVKTFALCDGHHMPHIKAEYAVRAGLVANRAAFSPEIDRDFDLRITGPNHFTWMLKAEYRGRDVMPVILNSIRASANRLTDGGDKGAKSVNNDAIGATLADIYGKIPTNVGHSKEYIRFWQGLGKTPDAISPLSLWEVPARIERHAQMWRQVEGFVNGDIPIDTYMSTFGPDHATDIIESMWAGLNKPFYINTPNRGAVPNMADDAFLELLCDLDMKGPRPRAVGPMPRGLRGMMETILDTHELTAEAATTGDYATLRRAMFTDPLTSSIADGDLIIDELLEAEREGIPHHDRFIASRPTRPSPTSQKQTELASQVR